MLTREQVYQIIDTERAYQEKTYNPDERVTSGQTRRERNLEISNSLPLLAAYVRKAEDAWVNTVGTNLPALQQVAKIAAIAVRALERAGGSEELLEKGLR